MIMVLHPAKCDVLTLADLLEALPPLHGETVRAWCDRTATALEGDRRALARMIGKAAQVNGQHLDLREDDLGVDLYESTFLSQ